jgi:hypothetical protein
MKKGKTKLTRHDAERHFEGLPARNAKVSSRPENPFGDELFDVTERADDEAKLWQDSLITLSSLIRSTVARNYHFGAGHGQIQFAKNQEHQLCACRWSNRAAAWQYRGTTA